VGLARSAGVAVLRGGQLVDAAMPHPSREVNDIAEDAGRHLDRARRAQHQHAGALCGRQLARIWRAGWSAAGPRVADPVHA
jgi:hypothetical protein